MSGSSLLLRADAGPTLGSGHVLRMLALAEAWAELGGSGTLLGRVPPGTVRRFREAGIETCLLESKGVEGDAEETRALAARLHAAWIVADGYDFTEAWQHQVHASGAKLMVVDDNAENGSYEAELVLNVNVHARESSYQRRSAKTQLLLGPKFAMVRSEIRRAASGARPEKLTATRWLVTMGAADPIDVTGRFLDAVAARPSLGITVDVLVGESNGRAAAYAERVTRSPTPIKLHQGVLDVTPFMRNADLAFSASGGTVWELGLLGVPCAAVALADNQLQLAAALASDGAILSLGDARTGRADDWLDALVALRDDTEQRRVLVEHARALVDGQGALRVARALREGQVDA